MNSGLLVVVALFLIYLAVTGRYTCVTAAARCVFAGEKLCACGPGADRKPVGGPGVLDPIETGRDIYNRTKDMIDRIRGRR